MQEVADAATLIHLDGLRARLEQLSALLATPGTPQTRRSARQCARSALRRIATMPGSRSPVGRRIIRALTSAETGDAADGETLAAELKLCACLVDVLLVAGGAMGEVMPPAKTLWVPDLGASEAHLWQAFADIVWALRGDAQLEHTAALPPSCGAPRWALRALPTNCAVVRGRGSQRHWLSTVLDACDPDVVVTFGRCNVAQQLASQDFRGFAWLGFHDRRELAAAYAVTGTGGRVPDALLFPAARRVAPRRLPLGSGGTRARGIRLWAIGSSQPGELTADAAPGAHSPGRTARPTGAGMRAALDEWRVVLSELSGVAPRPSPGPSAQPGTPPNLRRSGPTGLRVLIKRQVGMGDIIMSSVVARGVKERHPDAHVTFATSPQYMPLAQHFPYVDAVMNAGDVDADEFETAALFDDRHRFDFAPGEGQRERIDILCELAGVDPSDRKPTYALRADEERWALEYLRAKGWCEHRAHVGVVLSAAGRARNRSLAATASLLQALSQRHDLQPVLIDKDRGKAVQLDHGPDVVDTSGELDVCQLAAVISHLDVLITPDSGPLHLAAALDVPSIAFFSEVPACCRIGYYPNSVGLAKPELCDQYPCGYVDTCRDARCINQVGWEDIEPHLNQSLDVEKLVVRHDVEQPEDATSISMVVNQLTRALREPGVSVRQRPVLDARSAVHGNGCVVEASGQRFALLTCDNDVACGPWAREVIADHDYLLCFSRHIYDAYRRAGVPARKLLPFQLGLSDRLLGATAIPPDLPDSTFLFLFNGICQKRKNVEAAIQAFRRAFRRDEDVMLVIKNNPRAWDTHEQVAKLAGADLRAVEGRRIRVHSGLWTAEQLAGWYQRVAANGAYVHPHRAGGFELPVLEALAFGARVGTTGWGGVTDYCDDHLFPYQLSPSEFQVPELYHGGEPRPQWAEPDVADIRRWMRRMFAEGVAAPTPQSTRMRLRRDYTWRRAAHRLRWWTGNAHRRYLVFGGSGYGNLGDDAMTLALVEQIGAERCVVSSYAPEQGFPAWFEGVQVRSWGERGAAAVPADGLFADVHTLVIGGHGCRWPDILEGLCRHAAVALERGLKVEWRGIGIDDPDDQPLDRELVRHAFEAADYVSVRDDRSREILHELGVQRAVTCEPDLALQLQPASEDAVAALLSPLLDPMAQPYVVLSLNSMFVSAETLNDWAASVSSALEDGFQVICARLCHHIWDPREDDLLAATALRRHMGSPEGLHLLEQAVSPQEMMGVMAGAKLVIGMRYHSSVFAYRAGTPAIAVSEQDKTVRFCRSHGLRRVAPGEVGRLRGLMDEALFEGGR